ncbi:MAG: hypothetical protein KF746_23835 [Chitinophagaceae bacterium]|nr:hypothetical protein [Chitinophagaceae bacterium]
MAQQPAPPDPSCTTVENNDDVWYYFTAQTSSVIIRFSNIINDATGGRGIAGVALYQGACPSAATGIYCNNLHANGDGHQVINGLTIGETYYVRIWSTLGGINRNV